MHQLKDPIPAIAQKIYTALQSIGADWGTQRIKIKDAELAHRAGIPLRLLAVARDRIRQSGLLTIHSLTSKTVYAFPGAE